MKTCLFVLAILASVSASAQVTRLKPTTQSFVVPASGVVTTVGPWREDVDAPGWFDGITDKTCIRPTRSGEYLIGASLQWSLQTPDPQRGVRELQFYRLAPGASAPTLIDAIGVAPVQDFVTRQSATTQASVNAGDCLFVAGYHTGGVHIALLGTSFWVERIGALRAMARSRE